MGESLLPPVFFSVISQLGKLRLGESGYAVTATQCTSAQGKHRASLISASPFHRWGGRGPGAPSTIRAPHRPLTAPQGGLVSTCAAATVAMP